MKYNKQNPLKVFTAFSGYDSQCMALDEDNIDKLLNTKNAKGDQLISNSRLYAMAGNSIVVSCMEYIFRNLFIGVPEVEKEKQKPIELRLF